MIMFALQRGKVRGPGILRETFYGYVQTTPEIPNIIVKKSKNSDKYLFSSYFSSLRHKQN